MTNNKKIALITDTRFWQHGTGLWTRITALIDYLHNKCSLQIIFLGSISQTDAEQIASLGSHFEFTWLGNPRVSNKQAWINQFKINPHVDANIYIIIRTENSFILEALPSSAVKLVDTIDLVSNRTQKRQKFNIQEPFPLNAEQEKQLLNRYDGIICIQKNEYQQVVSWLGIDKAIYAPQPLQINPQSIRQQVKHIGIVASEAPANIDGLAYFFKSIWPKIKPTGITLNIYGRICQQLESKSKQVILHGFKENLIECYQDIDIAVNPVFYGAGLKIKSVEALAHGIPLVTSLEGASGIEELAGSGLLVATSPTEFAKHITALIGSKQNRLTLSENGLRYIQQHFNQDTAFQSLKEYLELD